MRVVPEGEEGGGVAVGHDGDGAPVAAVAAVGPAPGHVSLTAERDRPGAAVAPAEIDLDLVHELRLRHP